MQQEIKLSCITAIGCCGDQRDKLIQEMGRSDVMMRMALISTPVTPRPADVQRQEEMGKSLSFPLCLGLSCMLLLLLQPWAWADEAVCVF